ncbi:MAG: FAD-dependent oxidoreductase [Chloroflexi bacterium]|nr:FAD-dependent oxidoreductase [Chloroflexota bacterium]
MSWSSEPETLRTDVLVIGGGAAACMAAVSAHQEGARVLMVDKGQLAKSGCSPNAHGGAALFQKDPNDSWRVHAEDTLMSGGFMNDQEVVRVLCSEGRKFVHRLEEYGALWDRDPDGSYAVRQFGGHRFKRSVFSADETGHEMMNAMKREVFRRNIQVLNETMALKIVKDEERAVGAFCWDIGTGRLIDIQATATILATADAAGLWPSASERQRGDGFYLALDAGAELADLEFIQYHPTHAWWPFGVRGSVSESFRIEGGWLLNSEGERFMERYDPEKKELATRDKVSVCSYLEIREGRGAPHGGIYASVAHLPAKVIKERLRVIYRKYLSYGYDVTKDPIEIRPRPHYHCGGVRANARSETTLPGLYAAGAVTAGVHGANRLGSNSLVDILVFGDIAGRSAADYAVRAPAPSGRRQGAADMVARVERLFDLAEDKPLPTAPMRRRHVEWMDSRLGVLRNPEGMREMLAEVQRTREEELPRLRVFDRSRIYNFELRDALEMFYRLDVEDMVCRSALMRTESRGSHYREDYPRRNDREWLHNIVWLRRSSPGKDEFVHEIRPVAQTVIRLEDVPAYAGQDTPWH